MPDHSTMKLGKKAAKKDIRTLRLAHFIRALPPPLEVINWNHGIVDFGMMRNSDLGDCTCAALGHAEQTITANTVGFDEITVPDSDVVSLYSASCGYIPGNPSTDEGGVELDVLNYVRKNGMFGVDELIAYSDPDPGNVEHIKQTISLFGGVYIGLSLPVSAQNQDVWDVVSSPNSEPGSWGGHAVWVLGYDQQGLTCVTWGAAKRMTWDFWLKYCDESHAILFMNWLGQFGGDSVINMTALNNALHNVTH